MTGPAHDWRSAQGQYRERPLSETLRLAYRAADRLGVTRLADTTGLDRIGVPVFQAVRPLARSLSVAQGKGLTPMAAMVSALLESAEFAVAEALPPPTLIGPLAERGADAIDLWSALPRHPLAIRLAPAVRRGWIEGRDVASGAAIGVPWDLVSLDFTRPPRGDVVPNSVGLATGNSPAEAQVSAVAELLEHDLTAAWSRLAPTERRASELDLGSVDAAAAVRLVARIAAAGCRARVWSMGQDCNIACFRCVVTEDAADGGGLPPVLGSGCHPDRTVALLRALLEAIQVRVTLISGARDDLSLADYRDAAARTLSLILETFSFGAGPLPWRQVPHSPSARREDQLEALLAAVRCRTALPVIVVPLDPPADGLVTVRAIGPGLEDPDRQDGIAPSAAAARGVAAGPVRGRDRIVLFVGPSLPRALAPAWIEVRTPAVCGDLAGLLADPPAAVGLVDGCFEIAPTTWHKEILDLLAHGVGVFGAASLGALRAAELHGLGMTGVGAIFAAYRDGRMRRDDAVMLVHAPAELGSMPLTLSLVEAEHALDDVAMPAAERRMLQRIVRTTSFRERSWEACLAEFARRSGRRPVATAQALGAVPSIKQADTLLLIAALERMRGAAPGAPRERPPLTCYYRDLLASLGAAPSEAARA